MIKFGLLIDYIREVHPNITVQFYMDSDGDSFTISLLGYKQNISITPEIINGLGFYEAGRMIVEKFSEIKKPKRKSSSRTAPIIDMKILKEKLYPIVNSKRFPYDMPLQVINDLSKVEFDFENWTCPTENFPIVDGFSDYPCGYEYLSNGIPVLFVNAGGDWEYPICFVLYWDGKHIRGYIPADGNAYDKEEKSAYGNNGEYNEEDVETTVCPHKIRADVARIIKIKK